jgi:hypothetical protein
MDQDNPEETFQEVADIAKEAVQKVDEAQNVEQLQKEVDVAENESQQVEVIPIATNKVQEADATTET